MPPCLPENTAALPIMSYRERDKERAYRARGSESSSGRVARTNYRAEFTTCI